MYATGNMGDNLEIRAHALDTSKKEFLWIPYLLSSDTKDNKKITL